MENSTDIWAAFFKTGGVLLFVIAFLLFLLYLLKRFSNLGLIKSRQDHIKVLSIHHFSPREKVVLMEVMGKTFLLGVTAQNIQTLATIEQPEYIKPYIPKSNSESKTYKETVNRETVDKETENGV